MSFGLRSLRSWPDERGMASMICQWSSRCLAPSSSGSEVTSTIGKALFHLRYRKLPLAWHETSNGLFIDGTYSAKRQITEETIHIKAIVVTDQAAGTAGMKLVARPAPQAAINDETAQQGLTARTPPAKPFCHGAVTKHRVAYACALERWGCAWPRSRKSRTCGARGRVSTNNCLSVASNWRLLQQGRLRQTEPTRWRRRSCTGCWF
jgi:hypothetical protein